MTAACTPAPNPARAAVAVAVVVAVADRFAPARAGRPAWALGSCCRPALARDAYGRTRSGSTGAGTVVLSPLRGVGAGQPRLLLPLGAAGAVRLIVSAGLRGVAQWSRSTGAAGGTGAAGPAGVAEVARAAGVPLAAGAWGWDCIAGPVPVTARASGPTRTRRGVVALGPGRVRGLGRAAVPVPVRCTARPGTGPADGRPTAVADLTPRQRHWSSRPVLPGPLSAARVPASRSP